jgi:hypothetical protein
VTIDLALRGFRFGYVLTGRLEPHPRAPFAGRGWQREIVRAAVHALISR